FEGETAAAIAAAILMQPVRAPSEINHALTPDFDRVILAAVEKDRDLRVQSAAELRAQLRRLRRDSSSPAVAAVKRPKRFFWPIAIAAVMIVIAAAAGFLLMRRNAPPVATGDKRLAVLPFENLGAAQDNYFADGMTDEVRGKLASLRGLEVIARSSSDQYKNSRKPLPQIASELGVPYILTGR